MSLIRLDKYLADMKAGTRSEVKEYIRKGRVQVDEITVKKPEQKVDIMTQKVFLDGRMISYVTMEYYMLNKPSGVLTATMDKNAKTVLDLMNVKRKDLFPVGRLDYETEGLLLLTNDGDFTYKVTHPKFHTDKTYIATIKGGITISGINKLRNGVYIDDFKTSPAEAEILDAVDGHTYIKITIHEGKNRQVRKMFAAIGCTVVGLQRIKIGNVELGNLPLGRWRHLTSHEVNYLMNS